MAKKFSSVEPLSRDRKLAVYQSRLRLSEQIFRVAKWSLDVRLDEKKQSHQQPGRTMFEGHGSEGPPSTCSACRREPKWLR